MMLILSLHFKTISKQPQINYLNHKLLRNLSIRKIPFKFINETIQWIKNSKVYWLNYKDQNLQERIIKYTNLYLTDMMLDRY